MDELKNRLPAYGQHFRCMIRLIKSGVTYKLFEYLLDEYMKSLNENKTGGILIKCKTTARNISCSRNSIKTSFNELQNMRLVSVHGERYKINMDVMFGLVVAFNAIDKNDFDRQSQFIEALNEGYFGQLVSMFKYAPISPKFKIDSVNNEILNNTVEAIHPKTNMCDDVLKEKALQFGLYLIDKLMNQDLSI